ncbi:MAG: MarR family winged helix-turn-helix transcriptional regulator [Hyphomicrobiales bacterium]|nr:MarR family winged helix-turn-helix transcriptional regulator [Hyphomicrobiales bacterium]
MATATVNNECFDLGAFLPYRLAVAASRVSRDFAERYREEFGLSIPEWRVLAHLSQDGAVSVRDIYERVDMDKSKVSRAASRLQRAGLVRKGTNPHDRRLVTLSLSRKGKQLMRRVAPVAAGFQSELEARLGDTLPGLEAALNELAQGPE